MSTLDTLRSERDALEAKGDYESGPYVWLVERIAELEAAEPATPPAPAPESKPEATSPADRLAALERDFQEAVLHQDRFSDAQRHELIERLNHEIGEADRAALGTDDEPEPEDVAALAAQMREALAKGNALDPDEAAAFSTRFNRAVHDQVTRVTPSEELRALVAGSGVQVRYEAAAELERRGELDEATAAGMTTWLNEQVREADAAGPLADAEVPEHLKSLAADMLAQAERDAQRHEDPRDALISRYNQAVRQAGEAARQRDLAGVAAGASTTEPTGSTTEEARR